MGGIGIWQLLIVLLIVFLLFGSKRLKSLGGDLGDAIQGFRKSMGGTGDAEPSSLPRESHGAPLNGDTAHASTAQTERQS